MIEKYLDLLFLLLLVEFVILFVSDGDPSESKEDILSTIRVENLKLKNEVVIHTFGYSIDNPQCK